MRRLPQRLLAIELRTEIDRALAGDRQAERRAVRLALDNPDGVRASHVRHNLKEWRLTWLARARARALPGDHEPLVRSLEE